MSFRVSGKNIEVGEALRERVSARISEALEKYFDGGSSGHVTVGKEAFGFHTECVLHLDSGIVLRSDSIAADPNVSADQAVENMEKRLRRYHRRLKDYRANGHGNGRSARDLSSDAFGDGAIAEHDGDEDAAAFNPVVIAESTSVLKQLSVSEAVIELDVTGAPVMVFRHASHGRVNLVYRRADGNVGWIDPPAAPVEGH
jgi:ribosomal subunit interface protein